MDELMNSTTELDEELRSEQQETSFTCKNTGCAQACLSTDEGVNIFMKYCNACNIKLRSDLEEAFILPDTLVGDTAAGDILLADTPDDDAIHDLDNEIPVTIAEVTACLLSLVQAKDTSQMTVLRIGNHY